MTAARKNLSKTRQFRELQQLGEALKADLVKDNTTT